MKTGPKSKKLLFTFAVTILSLSVTLGMLMLADNADARGNRYEIRNDCLLKTARQFYPADNGIRIMCDHSTTRFDGSFYMTSNGSARSFTDSQIRTCGSPCPRK